MASNPSRGVRPRGGLFRDRWHPNRIPRVLGVTRGEVLVDPGAETMIEAAFTCRLGRDAELRDVKNGTLPMLAFSGAVEDGQAADDVPAT
jgi:hypothetical protein